MAWLCTMNDLQERRGLERGCPGLFGWEAITQGANAPTNTKDLLDSRSLVYYSLTLTIYDSLPVYARCCIRPIASYPQEGSGGEGT
jgi:hypothetical protein